MSLLSYVLLAITERLVCQIALGVLVSRFLAFIFIFCLQNLGICRDEIRHIPPQVAGICRDEIRHLGLRAEILAPRAARGQEWVFCNEISA